MGELKFSGLVNAYIKPSLVEEPIPGVKFYDGLCLSEFDPEITFKHADTEPLGKVIGSLESDEGYTCTIEPKDMKAFRKIIGFPAEPIRHKKLNRKSFKKALMAWGMPRNQAEKTCNYVANTPFWGCGYDYYAERHYNYIWR